MRMTLLVSVVICALAVNLNAGRLTSVTERATAVGVKIVNADIKLAVGEFSLRSAAPEQNLIMLLEGEYDDSKFVYDYDFDPSGMRGDLYFNSEMTSRFRTEARGQDNNWEMGLSPDVEWRVDGDIGAAKATIDFGGLALSELKLDVGAADARVDFSEPNKTTLNYFKVSAGACDLKMNDLGNARFDRLEFDGGVGSFRLDFSGNLDYRADARIEVGLGSIHIIIPSDVAVRLETDNGFLSSVKFSKRILKQVREDEDVYETDNFNEAKGRLFIRLDIGLGSADIEFK